MLLSTSSSRLALPPARRASLAFLIAAVLLLLGIEGTVRLGFERASQIQSRTRRELSRAVAPVRAGTPAVLLVGNSLLGSAVEPEVLQRLAGTTMDVRRVVVEDTRYLDWYFGIRRLFASGARPRVLALVMSTQQLADDGFRGDYSAHYLCTAADLWEASMRAGADRTRAAGFYAAHVSRFWGVRTEIRKWLLATAWPDVPDLLRSVRLRPRSKQERAVDGDKIRSRLLELGDLAVRNQALPVLIVPPSLGAADATDVVALATQGTGVLLVVPLAAGQMDSDHFEDGMHVNSRGASQFTRALAKSLNDVLGRLPQSQPVASGSSPGGSH